MKPAQNSALDELFQSIPNKLLSGARAWVASPAFNRREAPLRLFDHLAALRQAQRAFDLQKAVAAVFPENTGSTAALRHEMSALSDLLRDFLVWQELRQTPGQMEWLRLRTMRKQRLEKNFRLALREYHDWQNSSENQHLDRFLYAFWAGTEQYEWAESQKRGHEFPLHELQAQLDAWYAGHLLQLACMGQTQQMAGRREEVSADALEMLLEHLPTQPHLRLPAVDIYRLGYRMLAAPDDGRAMEAYRDSLAGYIHAASPAEARGLLVLAINHGIRRINAGDRDAVRRTLGFYQLGLEKKLLHDEQGRLSKYTYNNVLMTYLALEEWVAAAEFLDRFRAELPAAERDNVYQYNLAIYHFRRGSYDDAQELLRNVALPDPMYKLESRKMLLKIYYEQEAVVALESLLENLLLWLRRHGEIGYHREMYRNLARFTGRLLRLPPSDAEARKRLEKKILETPLVAERSWLLEKVRGG